MNTNELVVGMLVMAPRWDDDGYRCYEAAVVIDSLPNGRAGKNRLDVKVAFVIDDVEKLIPVNQMRCDLIPIGDDRAWFHAELDKIARGIKHLQVMEEKLRLFVN